MNAMDGLKVLLVAVSTFLTALGLAASVLNLLFTCLLRRERRAFAE